MFRLIHAVALATVFLHGPGFAEVYPDKPIRVIVPVPAGGTPDVTARLIAPGLAKILGQQLVIDNSPNRTAGARCAGTSASRA